jgi:hypothetical protein
MVDRSYFRILDISYLEHSISEGCFLDEANHERQRRPDSLKGLLCVYVGSGELGVASDSGDRQQLHGET